MVRAAARDRACAEPVWCMSCYKCFSNFLSAPDSSSTVNTEIQQKLWKHGGINMKTLLQQQFLICCIYICISKPTPENLRNESPIIYPSYLYLNIDIKKVSFTGNLLLQIQINNLGYNVYMQS